MKTQYASAERVLESFIKKSFQDISSNSYINIFLNALPTIGVILNEHRQVVFANKNLMELLNLETIENLIGQRPGEFLNCRNSKKEIGGCGTSKNCEVCGAVNTILQSQKTNEVVSMECRILTNEEQGNFAMDFRVEATPFQLDDNKYTIYTMVDISDEKRRVAMEKIFFHDIINKAGSLQGLVHLIHELNDKEELKEMTELMSLVSNEMIDEILAQRQLSSAENGELAVNYTSASSTDIIESISQQISHHPVAKDKHVQCCLHSDDVIVNTDLILLKRILLNMLKNALEAEPENATVSIDCKAVNDIIIYSVCNPSCIPDKVQLQIFQRSFSTKGTGRGLGTYSMKILGENYLHGKVDFMSSEKTGTIFSLSLDLLTTKL